MTPDRISWPHLAACILVLFTYSGFMVGYAVSAPDRYETELMGSLND